MQYFTPERFTPPDVELIIDHLAPLLPGLDWNSVRHLKDAWGWHVPSLDPEQGGLLILTQHDAGLHLRWLNSCRITIAAHTLPGDVPLWEAVRLLQDELPDRRDPRLLVAFSQRFAAPLPPPPREPGPPKGSAAAFLAACAEPTPDAWEHHADLVAAYNSWCEQTCPGYRLQEDELEAGLLDFMTAELTLGKGKRWRGIRLLTRDTPHPAAEAPTSPDEPLDSPPQLPPMSFAPQHNQARKPS
jgi:hypothetical protein